MGKILLNYLPLANIWFVMKYLRAVQKIKDWMTLHWNKKILIHMQMRHCCESLTKVNPSQVISDSTTKLDESKIRILKFKKSKKKSSWGKWEQSGICLLSMTMNSFQLSNNVFETDLSPLNTTAGFLYLMLTTLLDHKLHMPKLMFDYLISRVNLIF